MGSDAGIALPGVAVFGSSEPLEGTPLYETARLVGRLLAREGFMVVTGGYGGVMEAASRGAREEGGVALGITTRALAPLRAGPNPWLSRHLEEEGLFERTRELIGRSAGYIILPGKAGTLAELTFLWAMHRARLLSDRPIVLLGGAWPRFLEQLDALDIVDRDELAITSVASSPEEAVSFMRRIRTA
ncbi:MAG TPA: LOG family protein [Candidatus Polarisedimenticolia bacterium]|nr:LOG family protein [Candidatus Polarisedimenticolia bacterium]